MSGLEVPIKIRLIEHEVISMEFKHEPDRIFAWNPEGKTIAEITFPISDGIATIDHTFVDASLRGQGVAAMLVSSAVEQIRSAGLKARPTCSYAVKWFSEHPEHSDLL
ncbi:MAG: GNAT family N-acetyltransferase [Lawsonibacter sp.]|nr:GNAT family N-acetyltransferase [Lawsonibacter sp.]